MDNNQYDNEAINGEHTDNMAQQDENIDDMLMDEETMRPGDEDSDENGEVEKLKQELQEAKDKYVRLVAEFDNFRRRNAKESLEMKQTAGKDIIQAMLPVLDDSERAAKQIENAKDTDAIKEGLSLVFNKLRTVLQSKGLRAMDNADMTFNPDLHEAITEIPAPNEDMQGKIMDVIEPGYYLNDKLIRHAKVVVGK